MNRYLWIVEAFIDGEWLPTAGAYLTRYEARKQLLIDWSQHFRRRDLRVKKYVPEECRG